MHRRKEISRLEAKNLGEALGIDWEAFDVEEFRLGLEVEAGRVRWDSSTSIVFNDAFVLLAVSGDNDAFIKQVVAQYMEDFPGYLKKAWGKYFSGADFLPDNSYQPTDWKAEVLFT